MITAILIGLVVGVIVVLFTQWATVEDPKPSFFSDHPGVGVGVVVAAAIVAVWIRGHV